MENSEKINELKLYVEEYKKMEEQLIQLDGKKMSRQKLQCTKKYKENLRNKRQMEQTKRKYELYLEIISNPNIKMAEWEERFFNEAQKQIEKNEIDISRKRLSLRTYEKRKRRINADYKDKLDELKRIKLDLEKYNLNPGLLQQEYMDRINSIKNEIAKNDEIRKQLRQENELRNTKIDEEKIVLEQKLNDKKELGKSKISYFEKQFGNDSKYISEFKKIIGFDEKEKENKKDEDKKDDFKFELPPTHQNMDESFDIHFTDDSIYSEKSKNQTEVDDMTFRAIDEETRKQKLIGFHTYEVEPNGLKKLFKKVFNRRAKRLGQVSAENNTKKDESKAWRDSQRQAEYTHPTAARLNNSSNNVKREEQIR